MKGVDLMEETLKERYEQEANDILDSMQDLTADDPKYAEAVKNLKVVNDLKLSEMKHEEEIAANEAKTKSDKHFKVADVIIKATGVILPILAYSGFVVLGYALESDDEIMLSNTLKDVNQKFKPFK